VKSADYFCSNPVHRQTDRQTEWQTDRQTDPYRLGGGNY